MKKLLIGAGVVAVAAIALSQQHLVSAAQGDEIHLQCDKGDGRTSVRIDMDTTRLYARFRWSQNRGYINEIKNGFGQDNTEEDMIGNKITYRLTDSMIVQNDKIYFARYSKCINVEYAKEETLRNFTCASLNEYNDMATTHAEIDRDNSIFSDMEGKQHHCDPVATGGRAF